MSCNILIHLTLSMEKLFDPKASYLTCEKNVRKYLDSLSDEQLRTFFENIEYTPFPILLIKEYKKRFENS